MARLLASVSDQICLTWDSLVATFGLLFACLAPHIRVPRTDLTGKVALITGANSGIGYSLAVSLVERNATLYLACRNREKGEAAAQEIIDTVEGANSKNIHVVELDTSSLKSVRALPSQLCKQTQKISIDILIHNAGCTTTSKDNQVTEDGLGTIYTTNFLGSFLLTSILEKHLSSNARVIFTSSTGQYAADLSRIFTLLNMVPDRRKLPDSAIYADSKAFQVAFAHMLQQRFDRRYPEKHLVSHAFTPGYTMTPIFDKTITPSATADIVFWALKAATVLAIPVGQGAATGLWLATTDDKEVVGKENGGRFWDRCVSRMTATRLLPQEQLKRMWEVWEDHSGAEWT